MQEPNFRLMTAESDESRPGRPPSFHDIAKACGVSKAAVSLAFRNQPGVAAATRERIIKKASEMGYRNNPSVSALMEQIRMRRPIRSHEVLAVVTSFPRDIWNNPPSPVFKQFLSGVRERAESLGLKPEHFHCPPEYGSGKKLHRILRARGIRALLLFPLPPEKVDWLNDFDWSDFASATAGHSPYAPAIPRCASDIRSNTELALRRLRDLGYERIAMPMAPYVDKGLHYGWTAAYYHHQSLVPRKQRVPLPNKTFDKAAGEKFLEWFRSTNADALIITFPQQISTLQAAGYVLGKNLGLATLDWYEDGGKIAGVEARHTHSGRTAVELIASRLRDNELGLPECSHTTLIPGVWHAGESARQVPT